MGVREGIMETEGIRGSEVTGLTVGNPCRIIGANVPEKVGPVPPATGVPPP